MKTWVVCSDNDDQYFGDWVPYLTLEEAQEMYQALIEDGVQSVCICEVIQSNDGCYAPEVSQ